MAKKLFVSWTALLRNLRDGTVTNADLQTGIFYLDCCRSHVFEPDRRSPMGFDTVNAKSYNELLQFWEDDIATRRNAHQAVVEAVLKAEHEGRIAWREERDGFNTYGYLGNLLKRNGYSGVIFPDSLYYWHQEVTESITASGTTDLEVVL